MNSKIKILIGILAIGIILISGWWIWNQSRPIIDEKFCEQDGDCVLDSYGKDSCCPGCKVEAINRETEEKREIWRKINCGEKEKRECPMIECLTPEETQCVNNICVVKQLEVEPIRQVTITTDKTEYEQGGMIKIILKNALPRSIQYWQDGTWYEIQKFDGETWIPIKIYNPCFCGANCEPPGFFELKSKSEIWDSWGQKENCEKTQAITGRYRISAKLNIDENIKTIYSNEFTIKEKKISIIWRKVREDGLWVASDIACDKKGMLPFLCRSNCYERSYNEIWQLCKNNTDITYTAYTDTGVDVLCFSQGCMPDVSTNECRVLCPE